MARVADTFTYHDRADAKNLLDDLNNMEAVRAAPDPIAVAAKLTGDEPGDYPQGWGSAQGRLGPVFSQKNGRGRDCTDRDVALHAASNYVPFD